METEADRGRLRGWLKEWFGALRKERDVSPHTLASYKIAWRLLLRFGVEGRGLASTGDWRMSQVDREFVLAYLTHLEQQRGCTASTRNNRLAAVQSFFRWLRAVEPRLRDHCDRVLGIPHKRTHRPIIDYLERDELKAVLAAVDVGRPEGIRDLAVLALAYNTAARVHELALLRTSGLSLDAKPTVRLWGKGRKQRELPLWSGTADLLKTYLDAHRRLPADAASKPFVFLNQRGQRMTRWGIARILEQAMKRAESRCPTLAGKRLSAHSMRHTTAVHLLQSGVDLVTIQNWLGHSSPDSVHVYLALNLKSRRDLLDRCLQLDELLADRLDSDDDWLSPL